jgi:predicted DsbA family dithiol-disulfide isomerase
MLGINGVPFFLFDEKYAVSGAQPVELFLTALERAWADTRLKT